LAPYFLYSYVAILSYIERVKKQSQITFYAIQNSFQNEILGFIQYSNNQYFPFTMTRFTKYTRDPSWVYNHDTQLFTFSQLGVHSTTHNLPFIGASLSFKNETIGDLSDWIMDQKVHGPDAAIPLQVMIGAWRYYFDKTFMYSFKDYRLTAITDDGEEHEYNLENEEEIQKSITSNNLINTSETSNQNKVTQNEKKTE
jgi:hypothetical protein